jgi:hypothetical protein
LAVPQLVTGVWAVLAPANWFAHFPGLGPAIVAAEPPYNPHLVTDAGAGFLATGVALAVAAWLGTRGATLVASLGYAALAVPHLLYHLTSDAKVSRGTQISGGALLLIGPVLVAAVLWGLRSRAEPLTT